jgi:hypothetical protein
LDFDFLLHDLELRVGSDQLGLLLLGQSGDEGIGQAERRKFGLVSLPGVGPDRRTGPICHLSGEIVLQVLAPNGGHILIDCAYGRAYIQYL